MWRYLARAFWIRASLPGLGLMPVNAVLCAGAACLGFFVPGVWLLALGIETAYLFALVTSARFRTLIDAEALDSRREVNASSRESARQALERELPPQALARLRELQARCRRVLDLQRANQGEAFVIEANQEALERLTWALLKLLIARTHIERLAQGGTDARLRQQTSDLTAELAGSGLTDAVRQSKTATLEILRQRLDNLTRRDELLAEITSDLERIEAQVDLALENAAMPTGTGRVSIDVELAGHILDGSLYGTSEAMVSELDRSYSARRPVAASGT